MGEGAVLRKLPLDILLRRDKAVSPSKNLLRLEEANSSLTAARGGGRKFRRTKRERTEAATRRHAIGLGFCLGTLLFNTSLQFSAIVPAGAERCLLPAAGESLFPAERKMSSTGVAYGCRYHTPLRYFLTASALRHSPFSAGASSHRYPSDPRPSAGIRRFLTMERFWSKDVHKNKALVEHLQQYGVIKSSKVVEIMDTIDRGLFVPDGTAAYVDSPMQIGYNATISAPHMHAMCLELLEDHLQPGMHALDIGSGTGYLTACFALMVGPEGRAVGVEHIPELVATSMENIKRSAAAPLLKDGSLFIHVGDGRLGWQEFAPYDAIHVGAAAPQIPQPLIDQLKPGGRMVIPVGTLFQDLKVVDKKPDGSICVHTETSVRYVPLTSRESQLRD